jgi:hypothetical protein
MHTKSERRTGISMPRKRVARSLVSILVFGLIQTIIAPQMFYSQAQAATAGAGGCLSTVSDASASAVEVVNVANYCVLKFKFGNNSWTPPAGVMNIRILIVGGGGAGGSGRGGGGGAGGVYHNTNYSVASTTYSITVGNGGDANTSNKSGAPSVFGSTSINGGGAGGNWATDGVSTTGASGGGAGSNYSGANPNGGTFTAAIIDGVSVLGFGGGKCDTSAASSACNDTYRETGGGGGAGGVGKNGSGGTNQGAGGNSPDGGEGVTNDITGTSTYYGCGGGGASSLHYGEWNGGYKSAYRGSGGSSGCGDNTTGNGGTVTSLGYGTRATAGRANTGSGGGGDADAGGYNTSGVLNGTGAQNSLSGANGGTGVVIIRWVPLSLTSGTKSLTIAESQTVYLVATETTSGLSSTTRQWQYSMNSGSSWTNVSDGSGGTTTSYTSRQLGLVDSGIQYRCSTTVSDGTLSTTSYSTTWTVNVIVAPGSDTDTALTVSPSGGYAWAPDSPELDLSSAFTIEAWVYPTGFNTGNWSVILNKGLSYEIGIVSSDGVNGYWAYALSGYQGGSTLKTFAGVNSGVKVALNEWHHIAITRIALGDSVQMMVDGRYAYVGTADSATGTNIYNSNYPLVIGARSSTGETFTTAFQGKIDQVQIYSASLDQTEILKSVSRYDSTTASNLKFLYDFNEGSGSTIYNRVVGSTQNTNLTIVNGTTWSPVATIESTSALSGYRYVKFARTILTAGDKGWKTPSDVGRVTALIVGGGGGGGYNAGGGGSGGGIAYLKSAPISGFNKVIVGQAGAPSVGDSSFNVIIGGSKGGSSSFLTGSVVGGDPAGSNTGIGASSIYTNNTTSGSSQATNSGSGGRSAQSGAAPVGGVAGVSFSILGISETFSSGGSGGGGYGFSGALSVYGGGKGGDTSTAGSNGASGYGAGGGGGGLSSTTGGFGGNGVVIVRWLAVVKPVFTQPSNVFLTVGQVESFSVNMMADSATAGLTRTFRWESSTAGDAGPWVKVKEGTGYSNTFFAWTPVDTSTSGSTFLYRVIVTDSDTAGLYVQDTSTAVYATISPVILLTFKSTITKTVGASRTEIMTVAGGAPPLTYLLTPVHAFLSIDTSTATSPALLIADTATLGTYYETLTVSDSNSAIFTAPIKIVIVAPASFSGTGEQVDSSTVVYFDAGNSVSYGTAGTSNTWADISGATKNMAFSYNFGTTQTLLNGASRDLTGANPVQFMKNASCSKPAYSIDTVAALTFNGLNTCGYIQNVPYLAKYSVDLWVKRDGPQAGMRTALLANVYRSNGDDQNIIISWGGYYGDELSAGFTGDLTRYYTTSVVVPNLTWTHISVTYDGTTLRIVKNGDYANAGTLTKSMTWNTSKMDNGILFGLHAYGDTPTAASQDGFKGSISSIRIYSRPLSSAEILQNYNATKAKYLSSGNAKVIKKKFGLLYSDTYTVTAGAETLTATTTNTGITQIKWDTSTARSLKLTIQESLTVGTYYDTITVTDINGVSSILPISITISAGDTLTISVDTATVMVYNGKAATTYPKLIIKGLQGSDSITVSTKFSSVLYSETITVPTNADTYTVRGGDLTFISGALSNYAGVVYETSTLTILRAKQTPLNIFLYGGVVGAPFPIIPQGGSGTGTVTETLTGTSNIPGCSISNHTLFSTTTIQGFCEVRVVKNQDQNYFAETATVQMYFMLFTVDQPTGQGGGSTIGLTGKTTLTIDDTVTAIAPMITGFTLVGSTLTISGYGFGSAPVTVQFYRYVNASPNPTPYNSGQTIQVAVPSGASTGPVIVITTTGMAATDEVTIP